MISEIVSKILKCPVCQENLAVSSDGKSAKCCGAKKQHCFDFSADGYLSFPGQGGGDSKAAVAARREFLRKDYYLPASSCIVDTLKKYLANGGVIVDAGCGEGYYTSKLASVSDMTVGFDLSKFACSAAAKQAKREGVNNLLYSTASVFDLPIKDSTADAVVNIFAPCAEEEYSRILASGGILMTVGAGKNHLMGLKKVIYDNIYENGERADMPKNMKLVDRISSLHEIEIDGYNNIEALFLMTPYYWRTSEKDKEKLAQIEKLKTEVEFDIRIYKKDI